MQKCSAPSWTDATSAYHDSFALCNVLRVSAFMDGNRIIKIINTLPDNTPENFTNSPSLCTANHSTREFYYKVFSAQVSSVHIYSNTNTKYMNEWRMVTGKCQRMELMWRCVTRGMERRVKVECNAITVFKWSCHTLWQYGVQCAHHSSASGSLTHSHHLVVGCLLPQPLHLPL